MKLPYQQFENDVKMYGIQTRHTDARIRMLFENDVKYGTQICSHKISGGGSK